MHREPTRTRAVGHITVVQERRFLLVTDDGRGYQLTLAHDARPNIETVDALRRHGTHVVAEYSGEAGTASGVAHAVNPG
jgi:hypothetical protein